MSFKLSNTYLKLFIMTAAASAMLVNACIACIST
jgi:hypothetical protein